MGAPATATSCFKTEVECDATTALAVAAIISAFTMSYQRTFNRNIALTIDCGRLPLTLPAIGMSEPK